AIKHQSVKADRGKQQSEGAKETGQQSDDALVDQDATHHLVDRCRAERIFVAERFDCTTDCHCQYFGTLIGPDVKVERWSPLRGKLKLRKVNRCRGGITQAENPRVRGNANDFKILEFGPKAVTNALSNASP